MPEAASGEESEPQAVFWIGEWTMPSSVLSGGNVSALVAVPFADLQEALLFTTFVYDDYEWWYGNTMQSVLAAVKSNDTIDSKKGQRVHLHDIITSDKYDEYVRVCFWPEEVHVLSQAQAAKVLVDFEAYKSAVGFGSPPPAPPAESTTLYANVYTTGPEATKTDYVVFCTNFRDEEEAKAYLLFGGRQCENILNNLAMTYPQLCPLYNPNPDPDHDDRNYELGSFHAYDPNADLANKRLFRIYPSRTWLIFGHMYCTYVRNVYYNKQQEGPVQGPVHGPGWMPKSY